MKKIDYDKIILQAHKKGVSPQTEIKRHINYRLTTANIARSCGSCKNKTYVMYEKKRLQCSIIGEDKIKAADISKNYTCDCWKG